MFKPLLALAAVMISTVLVIPTVSQAADVSYSQASSVNFA